MKRNKKFYREEVGRHLAAMPEEQVHRSSDAIKTHVLAMREFNDARAAGCYLAMSHEVQTDALIAECRADGKLVAVPAFIEEDGFYRMATFAPDAVLAAGKWNIREPRNIEEVEMDRIDIMLIPGVAFDRAGHRVGHGGGYYDRMLSYARHRSPFKLALAFAGQLFDAVPSDDHDIPVDAIATEDGILMITDTEHN